jgi:hypothetical protein
MGIDDDAVLNRDVDAVQPEVAVTIKPLPSTTVTIYMTERTLTIAAVDADTRIATPQASPSARKPT